MATLIQWALPLTTVALIPKCPGCVAAYVLLVTGIGVSHPAATAMRSTLIALSVAALAYLLLRAARRTLTTPRLTRVPPPRAMGRRRADRGRGPWAYSADSRAQE